MPAYSLGGFTFIRANREDVRGGIPPLPTEHVSTQNTPGIDGVAIRNDGKWGDPFEYRTSAYCSDAATAISLQQLYQQAKGQVPQNLVWEGIDYDTATVRFAILDVRGIEMRLTASLIVDGTVHGAGYLVDATWTLLPVDM